MKMLVMLTLLSGTVFAHNFDVPVNCPFMEEGKNCDSIAKTYAKELLKTKTLSFEFLDQEYDSDCNLLTSYEGYQMGQGGEKSILVTVENQNCSLVSHQINESPRGLVVEE